MMWLQAARSASVTGGPGGGGGPFAGGLGGEDPEVRGVAVGEGEDGEADGGELVVALVGLEGEGPGDGGGEQLLVALQVGADGVLEGDGAVGVVAEHLGVLAAVLAVVAGGAGLGRRRGGAVAVASGALGDEVVADGLNDAAEIHQGGRLGGGWGGPGSGA